MRAFFHVRLNLAERALIQYVLERTWGESSKRKRKGQPWPESEPCEINLSGLAREWGYNRVNLTNAKNDLLRDGLIVRSGETYSINKNIDSWPDSRISPRAKDYAATAINSSFDQSETCSRSATPPVVDQLHPPVVDQLHPPVVDQLLNSSRSATPPVVDQLHPLIEERPRVLDFKEERLNHQTGQGTELASNSVEESVQKIPLDQPETKFEFGVAPSTIAQLLAWSATVTDDPKIVRGIPTWVSLVESRLPQFASVAIDWVQDAILRAVDKCDDLDVSKGGPSAYALGCLSRWIAAKGRPHVELQQAQTWANDSDDSVESAPIANAIIDPAAKAYYAAKRLKGKQP